MQIKHYFLLLFTVANVVWINLQNIDEFWLKIVKIHLNVRCFVKSIRSNPKSQ